MTATRGADSPFYSYADTLSWTKGKHAFKAGAELRIDQFEPMERQQFHSAGHSGRRWSACDRISTASLFPV